MTKALDWNQINRRFFDQAARVGYTPLSMRSPYVLEYLGLTREALIGNRDGHRERPKVLDLGCGTGQYLAWLNSFCQVWGVDISMGSLAVVPAEIERGRLICGNFLALPFPDAFFDAVFSNHTIEHTPDKGRVLDEVRRVLRSRGRLFLATPNRRGLPELWVDITGQGAYREINGHAEIMTPRELIHLVTRHSLRVKEHISQGIIYPGGIAIPWIGRYLSLVPLVRLVGLINMAFARRMVRLERQLTCGTALKEIGYDIILVCEK